MLEIIDRLGKHLDTPKGQRTAALNEKEEEDQEISDVRRLRQRINSLIAAGTTGKAAKELNSTGIPPMSPEIHQKLLQLHPTCTVSIHVLTLATLFDGQRVNDCHMSRMSAGRVRPVCETLEVARRA